MEWNSSGRANTDSAPEVWSIGTDRQKNGRNEVTMSDLDWMDAWKRMDAPRRERLGNAIGRLLEQGILVKGPAASPDEDYRALDRFEDAARGYLRTIGWDLTINRGQVVVQATTLNGPSPLPFDKGES